MSDDKPISHERLDLRVDRVGQECIYRAVDHSRVFLS